MSPDLDSFSVNKIRITSNGIACNGSQIVDKRLLKEHSESVNPLVAELCRGMGITLNAVISSLATIQLAYSGSNLARRRESASSFSGDDPAPAVAAQRSARAQDDDYSILSKLESGALSKNPDLCPHGKYQCRECGGPLFCIHGLQKILCDQCMDPANCFHGIRKASCPECHVTKVPAVCAHGLVKQKCTECKRKTRIYIFICPSIYKKYDQLKRNGVLMEWKKDFAVNAADLAFASTT